MSSSNNPNNPNYPRSSSPRTPPFRGPTPPRPSFDAPIMSPGYYNPYYGWMTTPPQTQFGNYFEPNYNETHVQDVHLQPTQFSETQVEETQVEETQVEETQVQPSQAKQKKKGKAAPQQWKQDEERCLGKVWIDVSEDPKVGRNQKSEWFWNRVTERFLKEMGRGPYRTKSQIYTKWGNLNKDTKLFASIYTKTDWGSGKNDKDILEDALRAFSDKKEKCFTHVEFWKVVKDHPLWLNPPPFQQYGGGSKRSKTSESTHTTSSDARVGFDLNDDNPTEEEAPPMGRTKAKRKGKSVASASVGDDSDEIKDMTSEISVLSTKIDRIVEATNQRTELEKEKELRKEKSRDMKLFFKNISHLPPDQQATALRYKEEIRRKYNL